MNPLATFDGALLSRVYVPVSQLAGRHLGSTACSLSRACIAPAVVFNAIRGWTLWESDPAKHDVFTIMFGFSMTLLLGALFWWRAAEADFVPNPYSLEPWFCRVAWWIMGAVFIPLTLGFGVLHDLSRIMEAVAIISVIYFRAVPAPPPKRQKRKAPVVAMPARVTA